jgi:cation-transporting ATPase 13A3/4/5
LAPPKLDQKTDNNRVLKLFQAMSSCTGITYVGNKLIGDPLDVEMFKFTDWNLDEPTQTESAENVIQYFYPSATLKDSQIIALMRRFDFNANVMRSSVICRDSKKNYVAFVKGSPERIKELCVS